MKKRILFRYYGYWYIARIEESEEMERMQDEQKREQRKSQPRNWQSF